MHPRPQGEPRKSRASTPLLCARPGREGRGLGLHNRTWPGPAWSQSLEKKRCAGPSHTRTEGGPTASGHGPPSPAPARPAEVFRLPSLAHGHLQQGLWVGARLGPGQHLPPRLRPFRGRVWWVLGQCLWLGDSEEAHTSPASMVRPLRAGSGPEPSQPTQLPAWPFEAAPLWALGKVVAPLMTRGFQSRRKVGCSHDSACE